jgi:hypothetical protein
VCVCAKTATLSVSILELRAAARAADESVCIYMSVCVYVCVCKYMCVCVNMCVYVYAFVCVYVCLEYVVCVISGWGFANKRKM